MDGERTVTLKIGDSTRAPVEIRGREVDRLHAEVSAQMESTGRQVRLLSIVENDDRAEVIAYG